MPPAQPQTDLPSWRLQDAKAQFSALVGNAMRGVPQYVTRRGKQAVVVLAAQDFEALQRSAAGQTSKPASFVEHLLTIPKTHAAAPTPRLDLQPREVDLS